MSGDSRSGAYAPYNSSESAYDYVATTKAAIQSKLQELELLQQDIDGLELPNATKQERHAPSELLLSAPKRIPSAPASGSLQRPISTPNLLTPGLINKTSPSHAAQATRVRQSPYTSPATHLMTKPINRSRSMSSIAPPVISPFSATKSHFTASSDALYTPLPSRSANQTPQLRHPSASRTFRFGSDISLQPSRAASQPDLSFQIPFTPISPASLPLSAPAMGPAGLLANPNSNASAGAALATGMPWSPQPMAMRESWPTRTVRPSQSLEQIAEMDALPENEIWAPPSLDIPDLGPLGIGQELLATDKEISDMLDLLNMLQEGAGGK